MTMADKTLQTKDISVLRITRDAVDSGRDCVAIEEPLEIGLNYYAEEGQVHQTISVTMRTPGEDSELAVGFLFSEGIVEKMSQVEAISGHGDNRIEVTLAAGHCPDVTRLQRNFYTTSSCGVCGKASIEALQTVGAEKLPLGNMRVDRATLQGLPGTLSESQAVFKQTGGLHAAALFDSSGKLLRVREDVGRHNALDKLIGACLRAGEAPLHERILLLSGRISFELVQKAVRAQVPVIAAIGAPSSLAIELATEYGVTTVGFLRDNRFNVYSGRDRIET